MRLSVLPTLSLAVICAVLPAVFGTAAAQPEAGRLVFGGGEEAVSERIIDYGFENVVVDVTEDRVTVWYENRVFRDPLTALGLVAYLSVSEADSLKTLELVPRNRNVALISISAAMADWKAFLDGKSSPDAFRGQLRVALERVGGEPLRPPHDAEVKNSSRFRTDVAVRPLFDFELGIADDPFRYFLALAPEVTSSPFHGGLVTLQAKLVLNNDFDPCELFDPVDIDSLDIPGPDCRPSFTPERNTVSWGGWLPFGVMAAGSAGLFPGERYGFAGEVGKLVLDGWLEVWARGDYSGRIQFLSDLITYSNLDQWSAYGGGTVRPRGIDIEATLQAGRYREGGWAVRADLDRRFHEVEVGFFGLFNRTDLPNGDRETNTIAGFTLRIPLPVKHYLKPSPVRPTTVPAFPFEYRESSVPDIATTVRFYDNLDRLRTRLYPSYIYNNVDKFRLGLTYLESER